jgi:biotin operon repressor
MPNTRHAKPDADPDASPERNLASGKLRGIQIGLNIICRITPVRSERERKAMIWLYNYAHIRHLTADQLTEELGIGRAEIREALTDPDANPAQFVRAVEALRSKFDAGLGAIYLTGNARQTQEGMALAAKRHVPVEIVGHTRMGKTESAWHFYLRHYMDRGIFLSCPPDEAERTFLFDMARRLGIGTGGGKKAGQVLPQIRACFGRGKIEFLVIDEGHFLWPADTRVKPKRLEHVRALYDMFHPSEVGIVVLATPQFTINMNAALAHNKRWAPGQWDGRVIRYHYKDTMTDADLEGVARQHAPDFTDDMIASLVLQAKATEGFCGMMVNTIMLAREKAEVRGEARVTRALLTEAQQQMVSGTRIAEMAKKLKGGAK